MKYEIAVGGRVWVELEGKYGTVTAVLGADRDGWFEVQLDGESQRYEWEGKWVWKA
jgi:hypothetical protein